MKNKKIFEETTPYSPSKIQPALMTWKEYLDYYNEHDKFHPSESYDSTYKKINTYMDIEDFPVFIKRIKRGDVYFELRSDGKENINDITLAIFDKYKKCVGYASDEWGALLINVVKEYRDYGFGLELKKEYFKINPYKKSGGYTSHGLLLNKKFWISEIKRYMANGWYSLLIKRGDLTRERLKEILSGMDMVSLKKYAERLRGEKDDSMVVDWGNEKDIVVMVNDGEFVVYDKKLIDIINKEKNTEGFFIKKGILGHILLQSLMDGDVVIKRYYSANKDMDTLLSKLTATYSFLYKVKIKDMDSDLDNQYFKPTKERLSGKGVFVDLNKLKNQENASYSHIKNKYDKKETRHLIHELAYGVE